MDSRTCFGIGVAVFILLLWDVARADDWEERVRHHFRSTEDPNSSRRWSRPRSPFFLPTGAIVSIIIMVMIFAGAVAAICWCVRRNRRMMAMQQPLMPPPMVPVAPVTAGATTYGFPGHQPPMPAAVVSPVMPYPPQQDFYQQPAPPYPQEALYAGNNIAHVQQPSTIPMPSPSAPPEPPPPYGYQANYPR